MAKMFREGQKVVCIEASRSYEYQCEAGKVYTVLHDDGRNCVQLRGEEGWYRRALFNPVNVIYLGGE